MEQNKISEDETQKYALRPRKDLKKPTRIRSNYYYEFNKKPKQLLSECMFVFVMMIN